MRMRRGGKGLTRMRLGLNMPVDSAAAWRVGEMVSLSRSRSTRQLHTGFKFGQHKHNLQNVRKKEG